MESQESVTSCDETRLRRRAKLNMVIVTKQPLITMPSRVAYP